MPRVRTTEDEYTVQGNFGCGWEDLTTETKASLIRQRIKEYRENQPGNYRWIKRRVKIAK